MRIAEIYASLQGEGLFAGTPSSFVRTSGCNLRCAWCDTPFTSWEPVGSERTAAAVHAEVLRLGMRHVVVTGGEPLLFADVVELCHLLRRDGLHVTIETAGTVPFPTGSPRPVADLVSISPKLASSAPPVGTPGGWRDRHEAARRRDDVLLAMMADGLCQLKFVIDSAADLDAASSWLEDLGRTRPIERRMVFLMPQGRTPEELARTAAWLEPACRARGVQFAPRHHIAWFGNTRGT